MPPRSSPCRAGAGLAENVFSSVKKGQPVLVEGRLHVSSYDDKDGVSRTSVEIDASTVGHDLTRGVSTFVKGELPARTDRDVAAELTRELDQEDLPAYHPTTGEVTAGGTGPTQDHSSTAA